MARRCPKCNSHVWDNRSTRLQAKDGKDRPYFSCMKVGCNWAEWDDPNWGER